MIVRQYKILIILVIFLFTAKSSFSQDTLNIDDDIVLSDIQQLNDSIEEFLNNGELKNLYKLYKKGAHLLIPGETFIGNKRIYRYWEKLIKDSDIDFEVVEVSLQERKIYDNQYYRSLDERPAGWRQRGIELDDDQPMIYEFGRATFKPKDKKNDGREADYIIVWQVQQDGTYKILVHTFS